MRILRHATVQPTHSPVKSTVRRLSLLVMVQNAAEARTGGGITGSFIEVRATDGKLSVGAHADSASFARSAPPAMELPTELTALYGPTFGRYVTNITVTPDFDLSARLASAWWQTLAQPAPDAIVSIDPIVLRALLRITGPLTLSDGPVVDTASVIEQMLVRPYLERTPLEQTAMQSDLTPHLFETLLDTPFDVAAWAQALAEPVAQGRVSVWSAHADEQAVLAEGPLAGTLARYRAAGDDAIGVYFNDATTGKLDTFLDVQVDPSTRVCRADGVAEVEVAVTLQSTLTDAARTYPPVDDRRHEPGSAGRHHDRRDRRGAQRLVFRRSRERRRGRRLDRCARREPGIRRSHRADTGTVADDDLPVPCGQGRTGARPGDRAHPDDEPGHGRAGRRGALRLTAPRLTLSRRRSRCGGPAGSRSGSHRTAAVRPARRSARPHPPPPPPARAARAR